MRTNTSRLAEHFPFGSILWLYSFCRCTVGALSRAIRSGCRAESQYLKAAPPTPDCCADQQQERLFHLLEHAFRPTVLVEALDNHDITCFIVQHDIPHIWHVANTQEAMTGIMLTLSRSSCDQVSMLLAYHLISL